MIIQMSVNDTRFVFVESVRFSNPLKVFKTQLIVLKEKLDFT